jgi:hypothetical protein
MKWHSECWWGHAQVNECSTAMGSRRHTTHRCSWWLRHDQRSRYIFVNKLSSNIKLVIDSIAFGHVFVLDHTCWLLDMKLILRARARHMPFMPQCSRADWIQQKELYELVRNLLWRSACCSWFFKNYLSMGEATIRIQLRLNAKQAAWDSVHQQPSFVIITTHARAPQVKIWVKLEWRSITSESARMSNWIWRTRELTKCSATSGDILIIITCIASSD